MIHTNLPTLCRVGGSEVPVTGSPVGGGDSDVDQSKVIYMAQVIGSAISINFDPF